MLGLSLLCLGVMAPPAQGPAVHPLHKADCLIFVLKDCPIANKSAPEMVRIIDKYQSKGIQFLLIYADSDGKLETMTKHAREYGYRIPVRLDADHSVAKRYGVSVSPTVVLVDEKSVYYTGRINDEFPAIGKRRAKTTSHDLRNALDAFLEGKPVKIPKTEAVGCRLY